jgi:hypothetical protein
VKTLLFSLENANKWINKIELKLSNPDNVLEQSNLENLSLNIQRIVNDLNVSGSGCDYVFYFFNCILFMDLI